ncbi:MAG: 4-hydroxy-3-methylbut-2-enyl diphosphate reductase [bacterium]|nr:4-hydroxy-3-methylbut-2-enyl diphosphate reductase [bacterium]
MSEIKIILAEKAGFCFGVRRAINTASKAIGQSRSGSVCSLGPLIHNPQVIQRLEMKGLRTVSSLNEIEGGALLIPSHGVVPSVVAEAKERQLEIIDATCPFVLKAQRIAADMAGQGYRIVILGDRGHPEVEAVLGCAGDEAVTVKSAEDCLQLPCDMAYALLAQTTQRLSTLQEIAAVLISRVPETRVFNTICEATEVRQRYADMLATDCDLMIVVGGFNSANTNRLVDICKEKTRTLHVETADGINIKDIEGASSIGVSAGASTPDWIINDVIRKIERLAGEV